MIVSYTPQGISKLNRALSLEVRVVIIQTRIAERIKKPFPLRSDCQDRHCNISFIGAKVEVGQGIVSMFSIHSLG